MFIIITRFCHKKFRRNFQRYKPYVKIHFARKGYVPSIMLINIMGYGLMAENENEMMAANLLEAMNKVLSEKIRKNCIWIDWTLTRKALQVHY